MLAKTYPAILFCSCLLQQPTINNIATMKIIRPGHSPLDPNIILDRKIHQLEDELSVRHLRTQALTIPAKESYLTDLVDCFTIQARIQEKREAEELRQCKLFSDTF